MNKLAKIYKENNRIYIMAKRAKKKTQKEEVENKKESVEVKSEKITKFPNLKKLFFKPSEFLNSVEKESKYESILRSYIIISLVYYIFSQIYSTIFNGFSAVNSLYALFNTVVFAIAFPFVISGIIHLAVIVFKGKEKFFNTFKPVTYALMISMIYQFIMLIIVVIIQFTSPFSVEMLNSISNSQDQAAISQAYSDFFAQPGAVTMLVSSVCLFFIMIIHMAVFIVKGLKKFQKLSRTRAILAVITPWIIAFFVFILLIMALSFSAGIAG